MDEDTPSPGKSDTAAIPAGRRSTQRTRVRVPQSSPAPDIPNGTPDQLIIQRTDGVPGAVPLLTTVPPKLEQSEDLEVVEKKEEAVKNIVHMIPKLEPVGMEVDKSEDGGEEDQVIKRRPGRPKKNPGSEVTLGGSSAINTLEVPKVGRGRLRGCGATTGRGRRKPPATEAPVAQISALHLDPGNPGDAGDTMESQEEVQVVQVNKESPKEDDSSRIRRSSRIKSLEKQHGPQRRRREVVFDTSSMSRPASGTGQDDDSSESSRDSRDVTMMTSQALKGLSGLPLSFTSALLAPLLKLQVNEEDQHRYFIPPPPLSHQAVLDNAVKSGSNLDNNVSESLGLKPLKVKSRWRHSSDAESCGGNSNDGNSISTSGTPTLPGAPHPSLMTISSQTLANVDVDMAALQQILQSLQKAKSDPEVPVTSPKKLIHKAGRISFDASDEELEDKLKRFEGIEDNIFRTERKISKESRGMVCDCFLSKEDMSRGEEGCGDDCLNRLLMVECGWRCPVSQVCTNRRFQDKAYCSLEVFKTEKKGHGLRTRQGLPAGGFVIEYVGEVLDPREFKQRVKDYAKTNQEHFYFMALKSDAIIDATLRGNCSRFINHSCEPNCETQKWTVNGELRIGFFASKNLLPGDEITFDYQFQRYGKKAQRCFCMTPSCRGWIGGESSEEPGTEKTRKEKVKSKASKVKLEDTAFEEELDKLERSGLKNRQHTLALSRLMVRAEDWDARERLLQLLIAADTPCRRLFLDYHGLRLMWSWMIQLPLPLQDPSQQLIRNDHYHSLFIKALLSLPIPNKSMLQDSKVLAVIERWSSAPRLSVFPEKPKDPPTSEATSQQETATEQETGTSGEKTDVLELTAAASSTTDWAFVSASQRLMDSWADLKEVFKIPKKERVEQMKAHEREADASMLSAVVSTLRDVEEWEFDRGAQSQFRKGIRPVTSIVDSNIGQPHRPRVVQPCFSDEHSHLSKEEKRSLFAQQAKQEEELLESRRQRDALVAMHELRCHQVGLDTATTPLLDISGTMWLQTEPTMEWRPLKPDLINYDPDIPSALMTLLQLLNHMTVRTQANGMATHMLTPNPEEVPEEHQQPTSFSFPEWPNGLPPPPPLPPATLPPGWKMALDDIGRCYYYDIRLRIPQWAPPSPGSSDCYLSDSTSSSDDGEDTEPGNPFTSSLPTEQEAAAHSQTLEVGSSTPDDNTAADAPMNKLPFVTLSKRLAERAERRKNTGLVQERLISPRLEEDERDCVATPSPAMNTKAAIRAKKLQLLELKKKRRLNSEAALDSYPSSGTGQDEIQDQLHTLNKKKASQMHRKRMKHDKMKARAAGRHRPPRKQSDSGTTTDKPGTPDDPDPMSDGVETGSAADDDDTDADISVRHIHADVEAEMDKSDVIIPGLGFDGEDLGHVVKKPPTSLDDKKKASSTGVLGASSASEKKAREASKETFRNQIAGVMVTFLSPYRRPDCEQGRIVSTEDFKHLARKLTHAILLKELKHTRDARSLAVTDSVKHKTKEFVKKYMARFNDGNYVKSLDDLVSDIK